MPATGGDRTKGWVLALTALASFMVALDALVLTTALGAIRLDLDTSIETLEWTVNAYNLAFGVLLLTGAALGDRFGRRRMFVAGIALFTGSSVACALASGAGALIAARTVQGAGAALVMPLAMALLSAAFAREERSKALGIFGGVTGLATIAGPLLGGIVAEGLAWRWIFWINVPIALAAIPLALRRIPESLGPAARMDLAGLVLVTAAAFGLVWGLVRGNGAGWASAEVLASLAGGAALALAFVAWERKAVAPMVPLRLFRARPFSAGIAAGVGLYAALTGTLFLLPQFFQAAQGHGPMGAGIRLLPWTATLLVVAPIAGNLVNRVGERPLVALGLFCQAAGMGWIALIAAPGLAYAALVAPLILAGAGVSMAMPAAQNAVLGAVAGPEIGKASGTFNMLRYLGGTFGIAIMVAVFAVLGSFATPATFSLGFAPAMGAAAALSLCGAIIGLALPSRDARALVPAKAA